MCGGVDADRKRDQPGEEYRHNGYENREYQTVADDFIDRQVIFKRVAEVSLQHAGHPGPVLFRH